jgi:hypothetical protein
MNVVAGGSSGKLWLYTSCNDGTGQVIIGSQSGSNTWLNIRDRSTSNPNTYTMTVADSNGDETFRVAESGTILIPQLPAKTSETNILYIDSTGALSSGATSGGGGVSSVAAGNGMDFTTITTTGSVTMGTPSTLTLSTSNAVTTSSHTHALSIANFTSSDAGLAPASGGGTTNFLRADGNWAVPPGGGDFSFGAVNTNCVCFKYLAGTSPAVVTPAILVGNKPTRITSSSTKFCLCHDAAFSIVYCCFGGHYTKYKSDCHCFVGSGTTSTGGLMIETKSATSTCVNSYFSDLHLGPRNTSAAGDDLILCGGCAGFGSGGSIHMRLPNNAFTGSDGSLCICNLPNINGACTLQIQSNVVSYCVDSSDCRLKCNLQPITCASSMLSGVCGYSVEYNDIIPSLSGSCSYALLAQDVEIYLPLAVVEDVITEEQNYKRIDYQQLIPVMWNIIKELEARIAVLESQ